MQKFFSVLGAAIMLFLDRDNYRSLDPQKSSPPSRFRMKERPSRPSSSITCQKSKDFFTSGEIGRKTMRRREKKVKRQHKGKNEKWIDVRKEGSVQYPTFLPPSLHIYLKWNNAAILLVESKGLFSMGLSQLLPYYSKEACTTNAATHCIGYYDS